ncbi:MAG: PLP-dependent aspartate aminotransferase family protein [Acidobacteriota bacterium]
MTDETPLRPGTRVIHGGQRAEPITGAVVPPIFTSATYAQESPGEHKGFEYSRSHNPTRYAFERMMASLESSTIGEDVDPSCGSFAFSSGLAAMATCLELLDAGDRMVAMDDLYGGSRRLLSNVRVRSQGLDVVYADLADLDAAERVLDADTKMLWVETPTNPMMKLVDLEALVELARSKNPHMILVCDNTFASPIFQRPLEHGFDISMHSTTKYINGHSDSVGGVLVVGRADLVEPVRYLQNAIGAVMSPWEASQVLRGVKTLDVRMRRHESNALALARHLEGHAKVESVIFPGLENHPQHDLFQRQMHGASGMITFIVHGGLAEARRFAESVRVFQLAESLGAVESLVNHPAIMTHASVPPETRAALGMTDSLLRLSVGIEDEQDLLADLDRALDAI